MQRSTAVFTICSKNYLAQAGVFFASVRQHLPDADLFLGLADEADAQEGTDDVRVIRADALDIPDFHRLAFGYDIMEFNTAIKPFMFLRLFDQGYKRVLYFDPDIMLFGGLDSVVDALAAGASFVLTPHLCSPPGVDAPRTEVDVMRTGVFNLGFLACSDRPETERILRWWARKLRYECINDQAGGIFVDQKFMDLVPGFADHARVLRDTSINVAYWNLAQRHVERHEAGWRVDGRPLGFFHFSGFDPLRPTLLSKHVKPGPVPDAVQALLTLYAQKLLAGPRHIEAPYGYANFASGTPIPAIARQMYREHTPVWSGDPFVTYEAYLALSSPNAVSGQAGEVINNLMEGFHSRSSELRARFNLQDRMHVSLFDRWFKENAKSHGITGPLIR